MSGRFGGETGREGVLHLFVCDFEQVRQKELTPPVLKVLLSKVVHFSENDRMSKLIPREHPFISVQYKIKARSTTTCHVEIYPKV